MAQYNINKHALVYIDDVAHYYLGELIPGFVTLSNAKTGAMYVHTFGDLATGVLTHAAWDAMLQTGRLRVAQTAGSGGTLLGDMDARDCRALDPAVEKMQAQAEVLDAAGVKNGYKATITGLNLHWTAEHIARHGPADNPHSVKRWRSERGEPGNRTAHHMLRKWGRTKHAPFVGSIVGETIQRASLNYYVGKTSFRSAHAEVTTEITRINDGFSNEYPRPTAPFVIPSYATVRRACIALEGTETLSARDGKTIVDSEWYGGGKPLTARRALQCSIIDHSPIPGFFVMDFDREMVVGHPQLTINIDVATGVILGHFVTYQAPSMYSVTEVIRRSNLPKRPPPMMAERYPGLTRICGKSAEFIVDNGVEFRGHSMEDLANSTGITIRHSKVGAPRYKARGERAFGTIFSKLRDHLSGATAPIAWARKANYDPAQHALVSVNELEAVLNHVIAEYHTEPHSGLNNVQPLLAWEKSVAIHGIDLIHDIKQFALEILEVKLDVQVSKSGVRVFGLRYHCIQGVPALLNDLVRLEPRRKRRDDATCQCKIKYDPSDISSIHVWNRHTSKYVTLKCSDPTYADGMPLSFHEDIQAAAKAEAAAFNTEKERLDARNRRVQAVRSISPDAKKRERQTVARLYDNSRIRQITGNIVHLNTEDPNAFRIEDFISHDLASATSLDSEIHSPRLPISSAQRRDAPRDRRAVLTSKSASSAAPPARRPRRVAGEYK